MDATITIFIPKLGEKPSKEESVLIFDDERALRSLLLGILANDTDFPPHSDVWCFAYDKKTTHPTPEGLLGAAIYLKAGKKKLEAQIATGPFEGLLESVRLQIEKPQDDQN